MILRLFKWTLYEHFSLTNLSVSLICLWLLSPSFLAYYYVRRKWKGNKTPTIDTFLRADIVITLKFLIDGRGVNSHFVKIYHPFRFITTPSPPPPPLNLWFPSWANIPILYPLRTSENRTYGFWLPTTIRNLIGRKRTTFKTFHLIINCINQIVMLILNSKDIDQFFLHSLIQMLMSALLLMTSKNPWMTVL